MKLLVLTVVYPPVTVLSHDQKTNQPTNRCLGPTHFPSVPKYEAFCLPGEA